MKKLLALIALTASAGAFAASVTIETSSGETPSGVGLRAHTLVVRENINKDVVGDVAASFLNRADGTGVVGRLEGGLSTSTKVMGLTLGVRGAVGQKFTNTVEHGYYSIEPSVSVPVGKFTARAGYRYRTAIDDSFSDTSRAGRYSVSYALTKKDLVGVRYDDIRGAGQSKFWSVNYTRRF